MGDRTLKPGRKTLKKRLPSGQAGAPKLFYFKPHFLCDFKLLGKFKILGQPLLGESMWWNKENSVEQGE